MMKEAEEMAQWVKHWPHEPDNLSSGPQNTCRKPDTVAHASAIPPVCLYQQLGGDSEESLATCQPTTLVYIATDKRCPIPNKMEGKD